MDSSTDTKPTPMMVQWHACKEEAPDAILLFRLGDFYEAFYDDAILLSKELEITLTKRQDIPMSGIPFHASDGYVDRLIEKGYKVAIAEQMEDPQVVKGLVRREIVRIITPGTLIQSTLLKDKCHNFVASLQLLNSTYGLALLDLSTGDFRAMQFDEAPSLFDELYRLLPKELLIAEKCYEVHRETLQEYAKSTGSLCTKKAEWHFEHKSSYDTLTHHLKVHNLDGFGLKGLTAAINACGALLSYISDELSLPTDHIESIHTETLGNFLSIDRTTQKHLELAQPLHDKAPSLLSHLDKTKTPMGGRLLREWLLHPLLNVQEIKDRQEAIPPLQKIASKLDDLLGGIRDLERLIMRIGSSIASPRDLLGLQQSLEPIPFIKNLLSSVDSPLIQKERLNLIDLFSLTEKIGTTLSEDPPLRLSDGGVIQNGVSEELDQLRSLRSSGHDWLANYQGTLRETTGIRTLKVGYTKAFGYYIEVSRGQAEKMPADFVRRQTLVSGERFISSALKEYEEKIFSAEEKILTLETELFHTLRAEVASFAREIRKIAKAVGVIDTLLSLAKTATLYRYQRPTITNDFSLEIQGGRHPVIETCLPKEHFVPNDLLLNDKERLLLLTGPNMAGKSTYLRQVAIIVIMAQMGSFVPVECAQIGIVDKVFSRIGASDDLSRGQSTFMVEMSETANILNHVTSRSLVILDEIGRGTSTYDGIAIAWAVAEYLLTTAGKQAKTLFATHYWELHSLEEKVPGAVNFKVAVAETADGIAFLHRIVRGEADKSYGIHVAKLAGLPTLALRKAQEILGKLEKDTFTKPTVRPSKQLDLFTPISQIDTVAEEILSKIRKSDVDNLTPLEALQWLASWKKQLS